MSQTPKTDAVVTHFDLEEYCLADEARKLELELNAANQHIEELRRAGNELAAWVESIYKMNHFLSIEQYKQIKRDLKDWEKAIQ